MKIQTYNPLLKGSVATAPLLVRSGFTLIELLVVISIIGLLASVILVSVNTARQRARDTKRVADMNQVMKAMELYFNENSAYPSTSGVLNAANLPGLSKFLLTFPTPPLPGDGSCVDQAATAEGQARNSYWYNGKASAYTITFCIGPSNPGGLTPGIHFITQGGIK